MALAVLTATVASTVPAGAGQSDPYLSRQWGLESIGAPAAWKISRGAGAVIAIVDDGVQPDHPDLQGNLLDGFDFVRNRRGGAPHNDGHGTMVAGVAAAVGGNGVGVSGVAPEARILPLRVCSIEESCQTRLIAKAIRYAARRGADVVNVSLQVGSTEEDFPKVMGAIAFAERKGTLVVAAAGNSSEPWCVEPASSALCVGAVGRDDRRALYSNSDVLMADDYVVAPSAGDQAACDDMILSTAIDAPTACELSEGYAFNTGTSLAAPFVTGVAALLAAEGADLATIRSCLLETTDDLGPEGRDPVFGYGKVNARRAVICAR